MYSREDGAVVSEEDLLEDRDDRRLVNLDLLRGGPEDAVVRERSHRVALADGHLTPVGVHVHHPAALLLLRCTEGPARGVGTVGSGFTSTTPLPCFRNYYDCGGSVFKGGSMVVRVVRLLVVMAGDSGRAALSS